jgi:hypothetical protein
VKKRAPIFCLLTHNTYIIIIIIIRLCMYNTITSIVITRSLGTFFFLIFGFKLMYPFWYNKMSSEGFNYSYIQREMVEGHFLAFIG